MLFQNARRRVLHFGIPKSPINQESHHQLLTKLQRKSNLDCSQSNKIEQAALC